MSINLRYIEIMFVYFVLDILMYDIIITTNTKRLIDFSRARRLKLFDFEFDCCQTIIVPLLFDMHINHTQLYI